MGWERTAGAGRVFHRPLLDHRGSAGRTWWAGASRAPGNEGTALCPRDQHQGTQDPAPGQACGSRGAILMCPVLFGPTLDFQQVFLGDS